MGKKELLKTSLRNCWYLNKLFMMVLLPIFVIQYLFYDISFNRILAQLGNVLIYVNFTFILIFAFVWGDKIKIWQGWLIGLPTFAALVFLKDNKIF